MQINLSLIMISMSLKLLVMFWCLSLSRTQILFSESVDGSVDFGNYTYYSYNGNYKIKLVLTTHSGDADLYVSQSDSSGRNVKPKFDLSEHDFSSTTCGQDVIHLYEDFRRPIGIGVYGHPSHERTEFTLDVIGVEYFDDNDRSDDSLYISNEELEFYEEFFGQAYSGLNKVPNKQRSVGSDADRHSNADNSKESHSETWDFVINLLANILHILLETIL